jgi:hypothetical protein
LPGDEKAEEETDPMLNGSHLTGTGDLHYDDIEIGQ